MIVPTMSNEEVLREINSDYAIVMRKAEYTIDEQRRKLTMAKAYPYLVVFDYVSPSKNKWVYLLDVKSKRHEIFVTCINYHFTDIGLRAGMPTKSGQTAFFNGHVFSRFEEREKLNITSPIDKMKAFFWKNHSIVYRTDTKLKDGTFKIIGTASTGVVLGTRVTSNFVIFNTYLSNDLLKGDQIGITESQKADLDEFLALPAASKI